MKTELHRTLHTTDDVENQGSKNDNHQLDDMEYKYISPSRLEKQAWFAARQRIMSDSDDDEELDDETCSLESGDLCPVDESHFRERPRTAPYRPQRPSQKVTHEPAAFSRPSRFRSQTVCPPDRKFVVRTEHSVEDGKYYADGSEIRHTVKSRDMSNYSQLKRCVVDQIDFIKQRDGIWSNARLYDAVTVLAKFMDEHQFRYIFLPDHQRQWLADMVTRLDQWNNMQLPWTSDYLKHKAFKDRQKKNQERVDEKCFRLINPQNFEKKQREKRARDEIVQQEILSRRKIDQSRKQTQLDRIENCSRNSTRKSRVAEQKIPIEFRSFRNSRVFSLNDSIPPKNSKSVNLVESVNSLNLTTVPHKEFKKEIQRKIQRKSSPKSRFRRPISHSPSLSIARATARAFLPGPKTAVNLPRSRSRSRKESSEVSVAPDDLRELLDLIQDIEKKQQEINGELLLLKEDTKSDINQNDFSRPEEQKPSRPKSEKDTTKTNSNSNTNTNTNTKSNTKMNSNTKSNATKNVISQKIPDSWWEGGATEPNDDEVLKTKERTSKEKTDQVVTAVYADLNSAVDDYLDRLFRQEFALFSSPPV